MRKGFTLLELLIVVIIVGILASIAIPQFLNAVEKGRVAKAKNALGLIAHAAKMYRAENDTYEELDGVESDGTGTALNDALGNFIELTAVDKDLDWTYGIEADVDTFTITATKIEGATHGTETITLNQDGVCAGTHTLKGKDCGDE